MSDEIIKKSEILYRPNLDYEKNYGTDSVYQDITSTIPNIEEDTDSSKKISDIIDMIEAIDKTIDSLPIDLSRSIKQPIKMIKDYINTIDPDLYDPDLLNDEIEISINKPETESDIIEDLEPLPNGQDPMPSLPDDIWSDSIPTVDVELNIDDTDNNIYIYDMVNVIDDYVQKLRHSISKYISNVVLATKQIGSKNIEYLYKTYTGSANKVKSPNMVHVSDLIIRSQIVRNQKMRMYKKLYTAEQTAIHIMSCKTSEQLKNRYNKENYISETDYPELNCNLFLSDSRNAYDKKYKENFMNLYKYLNSSVILLNEVLIMFSQEIQAKVILKKYENMGDKK